MKVFILILCSGLVSSTFGQNFHCGSKSEFMTDQWREMYLKYHNERRQLLEEGGQLLATGEYNIPGENIPPLDWSCYFESRVEGVLQGFCDGYNSSLLNGQSYNQISWNNTDLSTGYYVSCGPLTWWSPVSWSSMAYLAHNTTYVNFQAETFARMAWEKSTEVGCSFVKCNGMTHAMCMYRKPSTVPNELIYEPRSDQPTTPLPEEPQTTGCTPFSTAATVSDFESTTMYSTPFTTIVTRESTTEYSTPFPTSTLATMTPFTSGYETPETTPYGCPDTTRATRIFTDGPVTTIPYNVIPTCDTERTPWLTTGPSTDREYILEAHNLFRSKLANGNAVLPDYSRASPASNMYMLSYSCELEKIAQGWADRCLWEHSPSEYRNAGENLFQILVSHNDSASRYKRSAVLQASASWWSELQRYGGITRTNVTLTAENFALGIGHWSQMAWGKTTAVGCGFKECPQENGGVNYFVVCNYRQTGNYLNQDIYQIGRPCSLDSDCTTYPSSRCYRSQGLCYAS